ncbi:unnamed protein product [marine sediment metagenome]|uniref:Uncharacterized protein n=1 Tax=marine sediment metagenome TaxID=412755 RepID=X0VD79_9ZZZZ
MAQEKYHVYHIHISHSGRQHAYAGWKQTLGDNAIEVTDYKTIPFVVNAIITNGESAGKIVTKPADDAAFDGEGAKIDPEFL